MNKARQLVPWHRSFRSEQIRTLWTTKVLRSMEKRFSVTGFVLPGKRNACSIKILINDY